MTNDLKERLQIVSVLIGDVPDKWQVEITMDGEKFAFLRADDFRQMAQFAARIEALEAERDDLLILRAVWKLDAQRIEALEAQLADARKALWNVATMCHNVIFNCEQRPAGNQRHLDSWSGVRDYAERAALPKDPSTGSVQTAGEIADVLIATGNG